MSFNTPTFAIPGMMPTTHPVADSRNFTTYNGCLDIVFSVTEVPPTTVAFVLADHTGRRFFSDDGGSNYVRGEANDNRFVFGSEEDGYIPVGTCWLWVLEDGVLTKFTVVSQDSPWTTADNSAFCPPTDTSDPETGDDYLPGEYNWPAAFYGDTYEGFDEISILVNGEPPPNQLAEVTVEFRTTNNSQGNPALTLSTGLGTVEITDAENWLLSIPPVDLGLPPNRYYYRLRTSDTSDIVRTYLVGYLDIRD